MDCTSWQQQQQRRPTAGLPPDVLPLSGVLFSQSLMRPATPVFITAASCLDRVKGQLSLVVIGNRAKQEVAVNCALSSLSLLFSLSLTHTKFHEASHILHRLVFYLERAAAASGRGEHIAFLPHALDASYAVGDHGQIHRPRARGSGLLVLSLLRQSGDGLNRRTAAMAAQIKRRHIWR